MCQIDVEHKVFSASIHGWLLSTATSTTGGLGSQGTGPPSGSHSGNLVTASGLGVACLVGLGRPSNAFAPPNTHRRQKYIASVSVSRPALRFRTQCCHIFAAVSFWLAACPNT